GGAALRPGTSAAAARNLPSGRIVRPKLPSNIIAAAVYRARIAEATNSQPPTFSDHSDGANHPAAVNPAPTARVASTPVSALCAPSAALVPSAVNTARTAHQNPDPWLTVPAGGASAAGYAPTLISSHSVPNAAQNEPHFPCIAVARPSR